MTREGVDGPSPSLVCADVKLTAMGSALPTVSASHHPPDLSLRHYLRPRYTEGMTYYTDADIEMIELAQAGNDIANGVCPRCEDVLDPHAPKWAGKVWYHNPALTADDVAKTLGPHSNIVEGYHDRCLTDEW